MFMLAWKTDSHKQYIYMIEFSLKVEYHRKGNWWYDNEWLNRNFMYPCNQVESTGQAQPAGLSWTQPISARLKTRPSGGLLRSARWSKLSHGLHRPVRQRIGPNAAHRGQPEPAKPTKASERLMDTPLQGTAKLCGVTADKPDEVHSTPLSQMSVILSK